ncbi:MAG: hypothetical protein Q9167_000554 [Letrouitia subvulpina]
MSKCPDARDCLRDLVVPAMEKVVDKVDFTLSFIGSVENDDTIHCKHGPTECLGDIISLCAINLYPDDPVIYLGFTTCLIMSYSKIPDRDLVESCALEHGIKFQDLNQCVSEEGKGLDLLMASVERSKAAGVKTSCTVRVAGKVWCVRDGGEWKNCKAGNDPSDLVDSVETLLKPVSSYTTFNHGMVSANQPTQKSIDGTSGLLQHGQIRVLTAPVSQTSDGQIQASILPQKSSNRTILHSTHSKLSPISMTDGQHSENRTSTSLSGVISKHTGSSLSGLATGVLPPYGMHTPLRPDTSARYLNSSHAGIISPTTIASGYTISTTTASSSHNINRSTGTELIPAVTHSKEFMATPFASALITITFALDQPSSTLIYPSAVASSISRVAYSVGFSAAQSAAFAAISLVNSSASGTYAAVTTTATTVPSLPKYSTIDPPAVASTGLYTTSASGLSAAQSVSSVAMSSIVANESLVSQTIDDPTQTSVSTPEIASRTSEGVDQTLVSSEPASSQLASSRTAPSKPDLSTELAFTSSESSTGQISSGQVQASTSAVYPFPAAVVSQVNDGQVQAPGSISVSMPLPPLPLVGEALKGPPEVSPTIAPAAAPAIPSTGSPLAPSAFESPTAPPAISVTALSAPPPAAPPPPAETVTETAPAPPATGAPVVTETLAAAPPPGPNWSPEDTSSSSSSTQGPVGSPPIIVLPGNGGESPSSDAHLDHELKNTASLFGLVMIAVLL